MLTEDDILEALTQAYTLGISDGHAMSRGQGGRELIALIDEYTAKLTADLSPALGGGPGPIERRSFEPKDRLTPPTPDVALATTWEPGHVEPPGRRVVKPRKTPPPP